MKQREMMNSTENQDCHITEMELSRDRRTLTIHDNEGSSSNLSAFCLRQNAKDAITLAVKYNKKTIQIPDGLEISHMEVMGSSGVNIQFSDGHKRAIYPYSYLMELSKH